MRRSDRAAASHDAHPDAPPRVAVPLGLDPAVLNRLRVCPICRGATDHSAQPCWCCRRMLAALGGLWPAPVEVEVLRLFVLGDALHAVLAGYKGHPSPAARAHFRRVLADLLREKLAPQSGLLEGMGAWAVVPSGSPVVSWASHVGRAARHADPSEGRDTEPVAPGALCPGVAEQPNARARQHEAQRSKSCWPVRPLRLVTAVSTTTPGPKGSTPRAAERGTTRRSIAAVQLRHPLAELAGPLLEASGLEPIGLRAGSAPVAHLVPSPEAFAVAGQAVGRRVLLLEDVWTTGAHVLSAAAALVAAGAKQVRIVVVGRALAPARSARARVLVDTAS
jgi:hypothetical protein